MNAHPDKPFDLFVSFAPADRAWVEGFLLDGLRAAGVSCLSQGEFRLGACWTDEFERAVAQSSRVLLVLSAAYRADADQQFLDRMARYHEVRGDGASVVPLLLDAVDLPLGLQAKVSLSAVTEEQREAAVERLARECRSAPPPAPPDVPCPYPGMRPFDADGSHPYHGRSAEVEEILQALRHRRCLFLIGPSGSGKSSLALAGLLPRLRDGRAWAVLTPGERPATALAGLTDRLVPPRLLVVDQFEEVFTRADADEAARFSSALRDWVDTPDSLLLATVRSDFYPDLQRSAVLFPLFDANHRSVLTLGDEGVRQAIVGPATAGGVYVEPALVERLVAEAAGEPGLLPHMQETLRWLWARRRRRLLPLAAYKELGAGGRTGLQQAMAIVADAAIDGLPPARQAVARRVFLALVQFGDGRGDTRRRLPWAVLEGGGDRPGDFESVVGRLIKYRLLVVDQVRAGSELVTVLDLGHEALITGWPRLAGWIREFRAAEQVRRRLEQKALEWAGYERKAGLLDEIELREAEAWRATRRTPTWASARNWPL